MDRNSVFTVRIFFVEPSPIISVIINSLIELEFESYVVPDNLKEELISVIPENERNVIFLSIDTKKDIEKYLSYVEKLSGIAKEMVQIGAFVFDSMDEESRNKFLERGISTIDYSLIKNDTLSVMKNILTMFEAKGKRAYIRTKVIGDCKVHFYVKNKNEPIVGTVNDVSAVAFTCEISEVYKHYFTPNSYFSDVVLILRGLRIKVAAKSIGFNENNNTFYVFKICNYKIEDNKVVYEDKPTNEVIRKMHEYIRKTIQQILIDKLEAIKQEKNGKKELKENQPTKNI